MKRYAVLGLPCTALLVLSCGGSSDAGTGPTDTGPDLSYLAVFPDHYAGIVGAHVILQVTARDQAGGDVSVLITPRDLPFMDVQIFHVNLDSTIVLNSWVEAGAHIGTHASSATTSDIAVSIGGKEDGTLLSYFDVMTDAVFAEYQARGVAARQDMIITKEERDADPVPCTGEEQFTVQGTLPDWVVLN
jgi:hypothetical protein